MNKFGVAFLLLAAAAANPSLAADDGHSYMLVNAGTDRVDFADTHAQRHPDGSVTLSVLTVYAAGPVSYAVNQMSLNCASTKVATLSTLAYSAAGTEVPHDPVDTAVETIKPGTLGQSLKVSICDGADLYPRSKTINDTAVAVAKGRDLIAAAKK